MDPFSLGLASIAGAQNPDLLAQLLASTGQKPAMMDSPMGYYPMLGSQINPSQTPAAVPQAAQLPGAPTTGWDTTVTPEPTAAAGPNPAVAALAKAGNAISPFAGIQKPTMPTPDMKAGVAGNSSPARPAAIGNSQLALIMSQMLGHPATPQSLPTLGSLIKG